MEVSTARQLKALRDINDALTKGLQMTIAVLENFDRLPEEKRNILIKQMKELVESSYNVYRDEPTKH
jgi:hypothetical protein